MRGLRREPRPEKRARTRTACLPVHGGHGHCQGGSASCHRETGEAPTAQVPSDRLPGRGSNERNRDGVPISQMVGALDRLRCNRLSYDMEERLAYLQMVQAVITRMASNSFLIKGWSITLVAALFALAAGGTNPLFVYVAYFPAFMFWALDAYFLRQERLFRKLWDHVREVDSDIDFSMDAKQFTNEVDSIWDVAQSHTLKLFHGTITGTIVIVMLVMLAEQHLR